MNWCSSAGRYRYAAARRNLSSAISRAVNATDAELLHISSIDSGRREIRLSLTP